MAVCRSIAVQVGIAMPEALVVGCDEATDGGIAVSAIDHLKELAQASDVVLIGPGMVGDNDVRTLAHQLLSAASDTTFVLDALAIDALENCDVSKRSSAVVITPHAGEMARFLCDERETIENDPFHAAKRGVQRSGAVVILKGAETYVAAGADRSWICTEGTIGLATSGSGDVLAGILAGLLARGTEPTLAASWAVFLHATAGESLTKKHGTFGFLAREIPGEIPVLMDELSLRTRDF